MFIIFGSPLFKYFFFFLQMARSKMSLNNLIPIHCIQYTVYSIRSPIPIYERKLCIAFIEKYGQESVCLRWMCDAWGPGEAQHRIYTGHTVPIRGYCQFMMQNIFHPTTNNRQLSVYTSLQRRS